MNTILKNNKLILLLIILITASCDNQVLNKQPLDAPSNANFFESQSELQLAINGAYHELWWMSAGIPYPMILDNSTDFGYDRSDYIGNGQILSEGSATSTTDVFASTWSTMYAGIAACNNILDNMSKAKSVVSAQFYTQTEAQAKFLRAFYYSWLIEFYGDVPWVNHVQTIANSFIPRTPQKQIVDSLMSDLDYAVQNLPDTWSGKDAGRATKGAALTLKARIALNNGMWNVAAQSAKAVMDMGIYHLYPNYKELFEYAGMDNSEEIFEMPFQIGVQTASYPLVMGTRNEGAYSQLVPSQFLVDTYECTDGKSIDKTSLYDLAHPFRNRDPRLDATIVRPGAIADGFRFYTNPDSSMTWQILSSGDSTRVKNQDVTNPYATFTGYCWRKYVDPTDFPQNKTQSTIPFMYMRYAEDLLTYAEAKIESGSIDQSVLDAINQVRARAYGVDPGATNQYPAVTTTDQASLRQVVRYEWEVEFAGEGFRPFEIRRWKIGADVMNGKFLGRPKGGFGTITTVPVIDKDGHPTYGANESLYRTVDLRTFDSNRDYLWPIPQKEMDVNKKLTQNPGY